MMETWVLVAILVTSNGNIAAGPVDVFPEMDQCFAVREKIYQSLVKAEDTANKQLVCVRSNLETF